MARGSTPKLGSAQHHRQKRGLSFSCSSGSNSWSGSKGLKRALLAERLESLSPLRECCQGAFGRGLVWSSLPGNGQQVHWEAAQVAEGPLGRYGRRRPSIDREEARLSVTLRLGRQAWPLQGRRRTLFSPTVRARRAQVKAVAHKSKCTHINPFCTAHHGFQDALCVGPAIPGDG